MKHLRQYIRQILLTEAAKGPTDLPDDIFVQIKADNEFAEFEIVKKRKEYNGEPVYSRAVGAGSASGRDDGIYGSIQLYKISSGEVDRVGPCLEAWMISWSQASPGYGPMLYDLAMEYATAQGSGLMADRSEVSGDARKVWGYYLDSRSDVIPVQLDDAYSELTDTYEDDCDQKVAGGSDWDATIDQDDIDDNWPQHPLSKMYKKSNNSTIQELKALGKLVEL